MTKNCPYLVTGDEGIYCELAKIQVSEVWFLRQIVQVEQNPAISFGRPTILGTGIPTSALASRFIAGDSIADLVADYGIPPERVEVALRYELARKLVEESDRP